MLIRKIRLENFKKFKLPLEVEFGPGINVVKGPRNEVGKSTLLEGIVVVLFENPKSTSSQLDDLWTWGATSKGRLQIEFHADGEDYTLDKDFNNRTLRLTAQKRGEHWDVSRRVEEKLRGLLGTASDKLFLSTCCIRQDDLRAIQSGKEEASQNMERIITGGAQGITATEAIKQLDKHIKNVLRKGLERHADLPGPIASLRNKIAEHEQELANSRDDIKDIERLRLELPEIEKRLSDITEQYSRCRELLERNKKRQDIESEIGKLNKEYKEIDLLLADLDSLETEKQVIASQLESLHGFDNEQKLNDVRDRLKELDGKRRNIEEDLLKRRQELEEIERYLKRRTFLALLASKATLVAAGMIALAGFASAIWNNLTLIAAVLGVVLVIAGLMAKSAIAGDERDRDNLLTRIGAMQRGLEETTQEETKILAEMHCKSREEFNQKYARVGELKSRLRSCEAKYDALLKEKTRGELEQQKRDLVRDMAIAQERLTEDLKAIKLTAEELLKYQEQAKILEDERENLTRRKLEIEVELNHAACDAEDISRLEEELQELKERLQAEERKLRAYELARDFIAKARQETLEAVHEELQQKIQDYFSTFTNGKYQKVKLEPGTLQCTIFSDEKDGWVKPEDLSGGTIDQFYLAYRLALAQLIYRDKMPPLIFDDPFYNFDSLRLARALTTLKEISKCHQVIIFTLGDTYDTIADRVIELSAA